MARSWIIRSIVAVLRKLNFKHIMLFISDKTHWTLDKSSKNYFSQACEEIRYILNLDHLQIQSRYKKPIYISYHSTKDTSISPFSEKLELYNLLKKLKFDATLNVIDSHDDVDGKFIKNLDHGMDMSIKSLISRELGLVLEKIRKANPPKNFSDEKSISYTSDNLVYKFYELDNRINLEISKL